jgi:uncharacterized protein with GYD domain
MAMAHYVILATFTDQGLKAAKDSPKRAEAFRQMAQTFGVTVKDIFWTQGRYDIVAVTEAPDEIAATALNLSLSALGNIRTESLRAFSAEEMAKIVAKRFDWADLWSKLSQNNAAIVARSVRNGAISASRPRMASSASSPAGLACRP